jgi:hypothetical protein
MTRARQGISGSLAEPAAFFPDFFVPLPQPGFHFFLGQQQELPGLPQLNETAKISEFYQILQVLPRKLQMLSWHPFQHFLPGNDLFDLFKVLPEFGFVICWKFF